jgi:hypothetical protein
MKEAELYEVGKVYRFKRRDGNGELVAYFTRFDDGSAYVVFDEFELICEQDDDAWLIGIRDLEKRGFVLDGLLTKDGMPPGYFEQVPGSWQRDFPEEFEGDFEKRESLDD